MVAESYSQAAVLTPAQLRVTAGQHALITTPSVAVAATESGGASVDPQAPSQPVTVQMVATITNHMENAIQVLGVDSRSANVSATLTPADIAGGATAQVPVQLTVPASMAGNQVALTLEFSFAWSTGQALIGAQSVVEVPAAPPPSP